MIFSIDVIFYIRRLYRAKQWLALKTKEGKK